MYPDQIRRKYKKKKTYYVQVTGHRFKGANRTYLMDLEFKSAKSIRRKARKREGIKYRHFLSSVKIMPESSEIAKIPSVKEKFSEFYIEVKSRDLPSDKETTP